MTIPCYLGIDVGTQGLTALLAESAPGRSTHPEATAKKSTLNVLSIGVCDYGFVNDLPEGCYEQDPLQWEDALLEALKSISKTLEEGNNTVSIDAICVTGQMHGCVMIDKDGKNIGTARLWCDSRNQEEADELSELFGERMPKRLTAARYLWSLKHEPHKTERCVAITTPAGYIAHKLTSPNPNDDSPLPPLVLGVGEASGMFPIADDDDDDADDGYRAEWIAAFDGHVRAKFPERSLPSLGDFLPIVRRAGDTRPGRGGDGASVVLNRSAVFDAGGWLHEVRGLFLGNDDGDASGREVLVAPAEGDQPTALAASLIGRHGMISCSFGTSVVANMVGKTSGTKPKARTSMAAVDRFNAVNGQPISMVWLRNGTTYLNRIIESYGGDFGALLKRALAAPPDCGGLLALPFLDDEPGRNVTRGGTGTILGFGSSSGNHDAGNVVKAAMVSVMFNLYLGAQEVEAAEGDDDGLRTTTANREIVLTGGLTKTPDTGQVLADIFDRPVRLLEAADEGGAWGAALLAKYSYDRHRQSRDGSPPSPDDWLDFLLTIEATEQRSFSPQREAVRIYRSVRAKYEKLLELQPALDRVVNGP